MIPPATNPPPPDLGAGNQELVLLAAGSTPINLLRQIRQITGFGLLDARDLLQTCPSIIVTGLDQPQADDLLQTLRNAGATAETRLR